MPRLLDCEKFCEELPEISSIKIMDKKRFHPEGLFSEQIFGPLKNFTCQCGVYHGVSREGGTCNACGVDIINSDERRRRFAKIALPIPVVNPIFYDLLVSLGGNELKSSIDHLMKQEKSVMYKDGSEYVVTLNESSIPRGAKKWERLEAIHEIVTGLSEDLVKAGYEEFKEIQKNLDKLFLAHVIVLPPDLRPAAKGVERNNQVVDQINRFYMQLLTKKQIMKDTIVDIHNDKTLFYTYFKQLQRDVNELYENIINKLSKKEGLIRGNILGKRIDFSGRAVIIPDPTLTLNDCVLPYAMFLELFKLQISKRLIEIGTFKLLNDALDFVDECAELNNPVLFGICEEIAKDEVCILNRQPSLHRLSMIGFNIRVSLDNIIKIHPLVCPGFNADFDGDQMAVYVPIDDDSKDEVRQKLMMTKNLSNPANESLTATPSQDIILGIYMLTSDRIDRLSKEKVECKGEMISKGRKIFNDCLPDDYPVVDYSVGKKELIGILNEIKDNWEEHVTSEVLDEVKREGFKYSTLFGVTMSLDSCALDDAPSIRQELYENQDVRLQLAKVSGQDTEKLLKKTFKYSYMIESGARGSWDQVRQIILTRGFISNFGGQILPTPIKNSLLSGLTQEEFFNSTYGCRKGLLDVALNTGTSGYLSRKLIFTCANLQIDSSLDDCGTTDLLSVFVKNDKKAKMLVDRYYEDEGELKKITHQNFKEFVGKTIRIRSPILCTSPQICCKCYGDLHKVLRSKFIGVIAAQSLGECNTQLILRTFHTSGVAEIKGGESEDMLQMDIVGDLQSASKLLHQFKDKTYNEITEELFEIYNRTRQIHHVHFECVVSQLMWKGYMKWRLIKTRDKLEPDYRSVQTVPSYESWLLGLAFSNPKRHILRGILHGGIYSGVMDKILRGEKIT